MTCSKLQTLLIASLSLLVISCKQGGNKTETFTARQYYDSITYYYSLSRPIQQKLIDESTNTLLAIKNDKNVVIDSKALQVLLDSAIEKNFLRITDIQRIKEVDSEIGYKEKILTYLQTFDNFYRNEMQEFMQLLDQVNEDRFAKGSTLLLPKLQLIKEKQTEFENARDAFKSKYPLDPDGNIRVGPDYSFVRLSDFIYEQADLQDMEKIKLLSFSGQEDCDESNIYYEQFIVIRESTGDTVRVLSPCAAINLDKPKAEGYFIKPISADTAGKNSFVIFNKHLSDLEKRKFKTTIGMIIFHDLKSLKDDLKL